MSNMHPLIIALYASCGSGAKEQYKSGPFKGAWRDAVYKRAYAIGVSPTVQLTPTDRIHRDGNNPDWQMGYEDGQGDLERYKSQIV